MVLVGLTYWRMVMTNYLNVLKPETYLDENGVEKTSFLKVGVAFPHESGRGFNLKVTSGIAVSGDMVVLPPNPKGNQG
jgi:hypothetical protein